MHTKEKRAALGRVARCVAPALVVQFIRCQRPGFTVNGTGSLGSVIVSSPVPVSMSMVTVLGFNPKRFSALNAGSQSGTPSEVLPAKTWTWSGVIAGAATSICCNCVCVCMTASLLTCIKHLNVLLRTTSIIYTIFIYLSI